MPDPTPGGGPRRRSPLSQPRAWALAAAALAALYLVAGFLVAPWWLRRELSRRGPELLGREVTVERVRVNPLALSVTIDGLAVQGRDGGALLSWDRLYVNASAWPLLRREARLEALRLARFRFRPALDRAGTLNVQDVIDRLSSGSGAAEPGKADGGSDWVFGVDRLEVEDAEIEFRDLSRARPFATTIGPLTVRLSDFRTHRDANAPYSFSGSTESGETFSWTGSVLIDPIRSSGTFSFERLRLGKYAPYYEPSVGFELREGTLGVKARYELEWGAQRRLARIADGGLSIRSLALALPGAAGPSVELAEVDVAGVSADLLARDVVVGSVRLGGGVVRARRAPDGSFDLVAMSRPAGAPGPIAPGPGAAAPVPQVRVSDAGAPAPAPRWALRRLELAGWRVEVDDQVPSPPARVELTPVEVRLEGLASDPASVATLAASAARSNGGRVSVEGSVSIHRPSADLAVKAEGLDLTVANPYLAPYANLDARLGGGRLGVVGRARFDGSTTPPGWGFEGDVRVDGLSMLDAPRGKELAAWKGLAVNGVSASPSGASVKVVRWVEPRLRLQIEQDHSSNLGRVLRREGPDGGASPQPGAQAARAAAPQAAAPAPSGGAAPEPYPVSIASLHVVRGAAELSDRSVAPPVTFTLSDLDLRIRALSTAVTARSQVLARGVASGGTFEIDGTLSPRMVNDATDVRIRSKGVDLAPLHPYFAKYVGYGLEKGTLGLDLEYKVARRILAATNVIHVDQLTLGEEPTGSKEATSLPVKLGLAILRDKDGLIELDVPVEGNVDDPEFRLGKVIWSAIGNVFTKLVTAPFAALAKLVGGGGDARLDVVEFLPGAPEPTPSAERSIGSLTKALSERPSLRLAIEPVVDEAGDGRALRVEELRRRALAARGTGAPAKGAPAELSDEEYVKFLAAAYKALPPAPTASAAPGGAAPPPGSPAAPAEADPGAMEERVLATIALPPGALQALSQRRAESVRSRLVAAGVDAGRLSVAEPGERARKEGGTRVYFELR